MAVAVFDVDGRCRAANRLARRLFGGSQGSGDDDVPGHMQLGASDAWDEALRLAFESTETVSIELAATIGGHPARLLVHLSRHRYPVHGAVVAAVFDDVSELAARGDHDPLTSVGNRRMLANFEVGDSPRRSLTVLFIDLDGFKDVNDTWGHRTGDAVLRVVADRIRGVVRDTDLVVRYGGDEFVVVAQDPTDSDTGQLVTRIESALNETVMIEGKAIAIAASVGTAIGTSCSDGLEKLIQRADQSCYRRKMTRAETTQAVA